MPNPKVRTLTIGGVTYDLQDNISGYITGITSSDVTTALGFTPYNATNPNGYTNNTGTITSVQTTAGAHTTINVSSGAANFNIPTKTSHLTNDSGFITEAMMVVELSKSGSTYTADKTYAEIDAAIQSGVLVTVNYNTYAHSFDGSSGTSYFFSSRVIEATKATQTDLTLTPTGWSEDSYILAPTDAKLALTAITSGTTYYPIVATSSATAASRQYDRTGFVYKGTNGTSSVVGSAALTLGNATASGSADNKQGQLILYGSTAFTHTIQGAPTAARTIELPDKAGTIALISDIPTIPTTVSSFTNDAGYLTSSDIASVLKYKGTKTSYSALPSTGNITGDVWHVTDTGAEYAWDGSTWQELGTAIDLSNYLTTSDIADWAKASTKPTYTAAEVGALPDTTTIPSKTSDLQNDSGFIIGMTILSYGSSTWQDFLSAYNVNKVVYCRASSNSNPASGSQTRLAFMAYVNDATNPTNVEFQYYRSISTHTASQQGDQVYVYKLDKTAGWTVTVREASVKVVAGTGLSSSYSDGVITLTSDAPDLLFSMDTTDTKKLNITYS